MEAEGTLYLVAEVSVAFAGFTSVVGVFGGLGERSWSVSQLASLRLLVVTSLITLLTALLPLALHASGLKTEDVWATSSGVKAAQMLVLWIWMLSFRRFPSGDGYRRPLIWAATAMDIILFAVQVLNAGGFFETPAAPYIAHLYYLVIAACVSFVGAVSPLWKQGE